MIARYAARTAAFAMVYLVTFWASGPLGLALLVPPTVVGALWLAAQSRYGLRRFDVIALATTSMVAATLEGANLLAAAVAAVWAVGPALLFAVLLDRWLPGYWLRHGDRFRSSRTSAGRLAGAATLTALAALVLHAVVTPGTEPLLAAVQLVRDTTAIMLLTFAARAVRRPHATLSVVR